MVAQERHVAQDDRLLVVLVHDLIYILLLALCRLDTALPLHSERREHVPDELLCADASCLTFVILKLVSELDLVHAAAMDRHLESLHLHDILEPVLVKILCRIHVDAYDERTCELSLEAVYPLSGKAHLHSEIVDVHLVIHAFSPDGNDLKLRDFLVVRSCNPELRRYEYCLLDLVSVSLRRIVKDVSRMSLHICLHSVYSRNLLELSLESH